MNYTNIYTSLAATTSAYGEGAYSCGQYEQACQTTENTSVLAPLTGFFEQPVYVVLPVLLAVAIVLGAATFAVTRMVKSRKK